MRHAPAVFLGALAEPLSLWIEAGNEHGVVACRVYFQTSEKTAAESRDDCERVYDMAEAIS
jgi:hypothetical protein